MRAATAAALMPVLGLSLAACSGGGTAAKTTEASCEARPAARGPIIVRTISPGEKPSAIRLTDKWLWAPPAGGCVTAVTWLMAGTPARSCVQIGYTADNPHYPAASTDAPPLKVVHEEVGPACRVHRPGG